MIFRFLDFRRYFLYSRFTLFSLTLLAVFCFLPPLHAFLVDSFDSPRSENILKEGDFVGGGEPDARVPFVKSRLVKDEKRPGNVMEIAFNVSEGYGGTYVVFRKGKIPADFNTIRFWVRGSPSAFKIELKDDWIHSFIVGKADRAEWREIIIPITALSNFETLDRTKVKEFVFVFEDHRASPRLGAIFVDDLSFTNEKELKEARGKRLKPGFVFVNSKRVARTKLFRANKNQILKLTSRVPLKASFKIFRFEASWDGRHWFYLHEFSDPKERVFYFDWKIKNYPSGIYWLRSVLTDERGRRREGRRSAIEIQNDFPLDSFLDEIQKRTLAYFLNEVDPKTYLVKNRNAGEPFFSTGLSGFQWTAYVIAVERGWMKREEALRRMNRSIDFFLKLDRYNGLFSHWLGPNLKEIWEVGKGDVVETAYILAGALTAQAYFDGKSPLEIAFREKVNRLFGGIEWDLLLKRTKKENEKGLLPWLWSEKGAAGIEIEGYNEAMIAYLLALGASEHAIPPESWKAWARTYQKGSYGPYEVVACAPLFTHQYSHLWIDFRGIRDSYADYFENSVSATLVNREYSLKENGYPLEIWGLSASEGPGGYKAYGAPPLVSLAPIVNDGTIAPTAAAGSMMFTPPLSIAALRDMREEYGDRIWGEYGFKDALNPKKNWFSDGYLGLDQGPILIAIENYRTGLIWRLFMKNSYIQRGLERAGFLTTGNAMSKSETRNPKQIQNSNVTNSQPI